MVNALPKITGTLYGSVELFSSNIFSAIKILLFYESFWIFSALQKQARDISTPNKIQAGHIKLPRITVSSTGLCGMPSACISIHSLPLGIVVP